MCRAQIQDISTILLEIMQKHTVTNQLKEFFREFELFLL